MLSNEFIDWWFEPWVYAGSAVPPLYPAAARAGRRDGYRIWCEQARVAPDLPRLFDPAWQIAAADSAAKLIGAACLFAGLIAARQHDTAVLDELGFDDRKWCISVAATQPLIGCRDVFADDDPVELRGLCEIARRLDKSFPGIWSRLRLMLTPELGAGVESRMETASHAPAESAAMRAQRCWSLCQNRIDTVALQAQHAAAGPQAGFNAEDSTESVEDDLEEDAYET